MNEIETNKVYLQGLVCSEPEFNHSVKDEEFFSFERGVKPLLNLIDLGEDFSGFFVADKVVGKAASMLYILLKIEEIFAEVISQPALEILNKNGITDMVVPFFLCHSVSVGFAVIIQARRKGRLFL